MAGRTLPLFALALVACAPQVDVAQEEQAIRDRSASWLSMDAERDAAGVAALFADDGTVIWEQRAPVTGRDAIRAHMETSYAENPSGEGSFGPDRIDVARSGDLAVEQGSYENPADRGRYITIHEKVGDSWRIMADMSVSTAPNGGAPEWAVTQLSDWYEHFNNRDGSAITSLYAADARVGDARGQAAIRASFESGWAESDDTCMGAFDGFETILDLAAGWGRDFCTNGSGEATISHWLSFYELQSDGTWLIIRDRGQEVE